MKKSIYGSILENRTIEALKHVCVSNGIQTGPFGSQLHQKDYSLIGTPIITVEHLGDNRITHQNLPKVTNADKERLSRYSMVEGDIIFSRVGSVDRRSLVRKNEDGWLYSGRCLRVRPDPEKIDSRYLSWFFGLDLFKDYIRKIAVGATMPSLNTELLSNVPVIIPPFKEQRAIADVLSALDDKIELNRQMNQTLEQLAKSIYVKVIVNNPNNKNWKNDSLVGIANFIKGVSYSSSELVEESDSALVTLKSINRGGGYKVEGLKPYNGIYKPQQRIFPGEVVIAHTDLTQAADVIGRSARVEANKKYPNLIASLDLTIVRPSTQSISNEYIYSLLAYGNFPEFAYGYTNGTTVLHLSSKALAEYVFRVPPIESIAQYSSLVVPIFSQIDLNNEQSRTLSDLRDSLLPKLMSGQVIVKLTN